MAAGRLLATSTANHAILRRLVDTVVSGVVDSQVRLLGANEYHPVHVRASKSACIPSPLANDHVVLFLSQPGLTTPVDPADLGELFGLTQAEARLAVALAAGTSLAHYSEERGISVGTARNQLKRVLSKT